MTAKQVNRRFIVLIAAAVALFALAVFNSGMYAQSQEPEVAEPTEPPAAREPNPWRMYSSHPTVTFLHNAETGSVYRFESSSSVCGTADPKDGRCWKQMPFIGLDGVQSRTPPD